MLNALCTSRLLLRGEPTKKLLLIMKLTAIILLSACLGASARSDAQNISITLKNASLETVFNVIKQQTGYRFLYRDEVLKEAKPVSIDVKNATLETVLFICLKDQPLSYKIFENTVVINAKQIPALPSGDISSTADIPPPPIEIRGRVTNENGEPVEGASITIKGNKSGTTTDASGNFRIEAEKNDVLVFSGVGYRPIEITIGGQTTVNVQLERIDTEEKAVVVIGYGQAKKRNYTGAVSSMGNKEILKNPQADISNTLVGRLPGVIAVQSSGEPGYDGSNIYIRGVSTIGNNSALIVIDGIPRDDYGFSQIDPNEIETLSVLKDAAAAAVFGVRAANGVILITTKRGKSGRPVLSFSARFDIQKPTRLPKYVNSYDFAILKNEGLRNEGLPELYTPDDLQKYKDGSSPNTHPNTDWFDVGLKSSAPMSQYNLNMSGGAEKFRYFLSFGYLDQEGLFTYVGFKRFNFRSNIDVDATSTTNIQLDVSGRHENRFSQHLTTIEIFKSLLQNNPTTVAYLTNGLPATVNGPNPVAVDKSGYRNNRNYVLMNVLSITQKIPFVAGLSAKGVLAYDKAFNYEKQWITPWQTYTFTPPDVYTPTFASGSSASLRQTNNDNYNATAEAHLNYERVLGKHGVRALVLYSQNTYDYNEIFAGRIDYLSPAIDEIYAGSAASASNGGSSQQRSRQGVVGRINYDFENKYFIEGNFRYDGSENFAKNNRWGFFPAISAGWIISNEDFFRKALPSFEYLKIRGSWGQLGNDKIERAAYLSAFGYSGNYVINNQVVQTIAEARLGNPNITWEKSNNSNIGVEGSAWKSKLTFEFDFFSKQTKDILGQRNLSIPATAGIPDNRKPFENVATVDNKGFEISLGHYNSIGRDFKYYVNANFTYAKNKLVFADESSNIPEYQRRTGQPLNQFIGYQAIGLFQSDAEIANSPTQGDPGVIKPGDIKYADFDKNGKIDGLDQTYIGKSTIPQFVYGVSIGASFKGFEFSMLWQGAGKADTYIDWEAAWAFAGGGGALTRHLDRWTPDNPGGTYPRMTSNFTPNNTLYSSYWLEDASYLRLKNLYVSYTFPNSWWGGTGIKNIRLFVSGQNLVTISGIKEFDPEGLGASNAAVRGWFYPMQKVYSFGINFNF